MDEKDIQWQRVKDGIRLTKGKWCAYGGYRDTPELNSITAIGGRYSGWYAYIPKGMLAQILFEKPRRKIVHADTWQDPKITIPSDGRFVRVIPRNYRTEGVCLSFWKDGTEYVPGTGGPISKEHEALAWIDDPKFLSEGEE